MSMEEGINASKEERASADTLNGTSKTEIRKDAAKLLSDISKVEIALDTLRSNTDQVGYEVTNMLVKFAEINNTISSLFKDVMTDKPPEIDMLGYVLKWEIAEMFNSIRKINIAARGFDDEMTVVPPELGQLKYLVRLKCKKYQMSAQLDCLKESNCSGNLTTTEPSQYNTSVFSSIIEILEGGLKLSTEEDEATTDSSQILNSKDEVVTENLETLDSSDIEEEGAKLSTDEVQTLIENEEINTEMCVVDHMMKEAE